MANKDSVDDKLKAGTHVLLDYLDSTGKVRRLILDVNHPLAVEAYKRFT